MKSTPEPKSFSVIKEKYFPPVAKDKASGLPKKYVRGLSPSTAKARAAHWKEKAKLSDSDPRAYEPAPGDATAKTKPSKHTVAVRKMMDEAELQKVRRLPRSGNITAVMDKRQETGRVSEDVVAEGAADSSLAAKAEKSGISVGTLRKVYKRGVAAWNSGHRPGTTPQQWGHARVNSYINKGKTYHTADKDLREETEEDINTLFEMQLMGTDEYRKHAIAMTPGQGEIEDAYKSKKTVKSEEAECECGGDCGCKDGSQNESVGGASERSVPKSFRDLRTEAKKEKEEDTEVTAVFDPKLGDSKKKTKNLKSPPRNLDSTMQGLPVASRFNAYEEKKPEEKGFMPTPRQVPAPPGGHSVPKGYKRVKDHIAGWKLVKEEDSSELTLEEAVQYHTENNISFTQNVFRPGSEGMKKKGDKMVPNCVPVSEEGDPTGGKGIGKPFRSGGGGAVYVRVGDGIRKITFSNSGMAKKYNDPARVRSFVARHHCLTNKDKTSRSYWACRWPRYFSDSGQTWW